MFCACVGFSVIMCVFSQDRCVCVCFPRCGETESSESCFSSGVMDATETSGGMMKLLLLRWKKKITLLLLMME